MKTNTHFLSYLALMFQTKVVEKTKHTHFIFNNFYFSSKIVPFMR